MLKSKSCNQYKSRNRKTANQLVFVRDACAKCWFFVEVLYFTEDYNLRELSISKIFSRKTKETHGHQNRNLLTDRLDSFCFCQANLK